MSTNTNVSDDLDEDIVNACMPSTCDVKPYDFELLATGAVPRQSVRGSSSEASDSDRSDEDDEMTAIPEQEDSDWYVITICCTSGV